jgi:hypothetical protein
MTLRITFDLPDGPAQLLLRLVSHIRTHTGTEPDCAAVCQSMVTDILVEDAVEHGVVAAAGRVVQ